MPRPFRRLCLPKFVPSLQHEWPAYDFLVPFVDEIAAFQRKVHSRVLDPLLRLFALLLELPEDYFAKVSGRFLRERNSGAGN